MTSRERDGRRSRNEQESETISYKVSDEDSEVYEGDHEETSKRTSIDDEVKRSEEDEEADVATDGVAEITRLVEEIDTTPRNLTDREWKESISRGEEGEIVSPPNERARQIMNGFRIRSMTMRDADSGVVVWTSEDWGKERFDEETETHIPKSILELKAVSREITFSSEEEMKDFRLEQRIFLYAQCIEEWKFKFGFVMPGSTNTWQQTIQAAEQTLPASVLSGNVVLETGFYEEDDLICKSVLRLYYD